MKQSLAIELGFQKESGGKIISNKIDVGDSSELYSVVSVVDALNKGEVGKSFILFRKNNIVVWLISTPDIEIGTLLELAKKQDAKISRILEMIK